MSNFHAMTSHARRARLLASVGAMALGLVGPAMAQSQAVLPGVVQAPSVAPPSSTPGAPVAPGVPFSAIVGTTPTKLSPPPSNQSMAIDGAAVDRQIQGAVSQADARVQTMDIGRTPMDLPNMAPIRGELETLTSIQRSTRLLEAKRLQAEMAAKLWVTVFDPVKEKALADAATPDPSKTGSASIIPGTNPVTPSLVTPQPNVVIKPVTPVSVTPPIEAPPPLLPYPKVVQIIGTNGNLRATLLVPYVGEVRSVVGTTLPGGRRVTKVTAMEVIVSDKKDGNVVLGFGTSVPLAPPAPPVAQLTQPIPFPGSSPGGFRPVQNSPPSFAVPTPPTFPQAATTPTPLPAR